MNTSIVLENLDADLWRMEYPLSMLGMNMHRVVTIIRLGSGKLIVHSTAPFSPLETDLIRDLGQPEWLVDVLLRHDTFAKEGHSAFPEASYLAPDGFSADLPFPTGLLLSPPAEWAGEVEVAAVEGAPTFSEIVMWHRASRTLIVGDLLVNFKGLEGWWEKLLAKMASVGGEYAPGMTKPFKGAIKDREAFAACIHRILEWDFDRIVVGHGKMIATGGKEALRETMRRAGMISF